MFSLSNSLFRRCSLENLASSACTRPSDRCHQAVAMASNPPEGSNDDFLEQFLGIHTSSVAAQGTEHGLSSGDGLSGYGGPMMLHLSSGDGSGHVGGVVGAGGNGFHGSMFPLGLSLDPGKTGFVKPEDASGRASSMKNAYHGQPMPNTVSPGPHPPAIRPRVRARRGQATDPHSIAERLRRERIAERIRALQELVPSVNKTDRAIMLDQIVDYVKFLRLQVKVLSMSRLGGAGAVAPLVTEIPMSFVEDDGSESGRSQPAWEKWSDDDTERQVAKLMEENVGAAMQFLQSKALCIMPISLASAIYHTQQPPDSTTVIKTSSSSVSST